MKLLNGNLLVEFESEYIHQEATGMLISHIFDLERHQSIKAKVIDIPDNGDVFCERTIFSRPKNTCMIDDVVLLHYMECQTALGTGNENRKESTSWFHEGKIRAILPCSAVLAFIRDGKLHAAPGKTIAERISKPKSFAGFELVYDNDYVNNTYVIKHIGEDLDPSTTLFKSPKDIAVGDKIMTEINTGYDLEVEEHRTVTDYAAVVFETHLILARRVRHAVEDIDIGIY